MIIPPPPTLDSLRAGTRLVAGLGYSTVLPDIDFETYSEAGFVWSSDTSKWTCLPRASQGKKGLPVVGAARYVEHPTAEILSMAYDLKDGEGRRHWTPEDPLFPDDLYFHILNGGLLEAWTASFERLVWDRLGPHYAFPPMPHSQWRCAMAKARAHALPGKLEAAGAVLNTPIQKDKDGKRLLDKFSIPRNPTQKDPRLRIRPNDDPADAKRLYDYNVQDIAAEAEVSSLVPDLEGEELDYWQIDQEINARGVQIDTETISHAANIVEEALARYNAELLTLTGGTVEAASEIAKLAGWLGAHGVHLGSLDEEHVGAALARDDLPLPARRALEIRALVGSASVKKLFAMQNSVCADGRLRGLFTYHGAHTGRTTGAGPQPTNLPNHGPSVHFCNLCNRYSGRTHEYCPWCGGDAMHAEIKEWNPLAMEDAIEVIRTGSLTALEMFFGDALPAISGCLRGMFVAAPGHDLICSDYSAIEAVVLAEMAGEAWRQEVFRTHGKIYEMSAAKISGVPFEEIIGYKKTTGAHHPLRKTLGKVAELACFGPHTQVLTGRGYVSIKDVSITDKLWDGREWVSHQGVVKKGVREVIDLDGIAVTPSHPISLRGFWREAKLLASNPSILTLALETGSESLQLLASNLGREGVLRLLKSPATAGLSSPAMSCVYDIVNAGPRHRFLIKTRSGHLLVHNSGYGGWIGAWKAFGADAFMDDDQIKAAILAWRAASPAIVELWGGQKRNWKPELYGTEGAMISAVLRPGREFWSHGFRWLMQGDVLYCRLYSGRNLTYHRPRLSLSTRPYHEGEWELNYEGWNTNPLNGPIGWIRKQTFGGRAVENLCQAVARDIQRHAIVNQERAGYPIVLHVYDENVAEVPEGFGSIEEFERIMSTMPAWAFGWPVKAAGGWRGKRYRKD